MLARRSTTAAAIRLHPSAAASKRNNLKVKTKCIKNCPCENIAQTIVVSLMDANEMVFPVRGKLTVH